MRRYQHTIGRLAWGMMVLGLLAGPAVGEDLISLEWRPLDQQALVGDTVGVGLYAVSITGENEAFNSAQVIVNWDPGFLELLGVTQAGAVLQPPGDSSAFTPGDGFGFNEADPPADGDGIWFGLVALGAEREATPAGALLTTLEFEALAETPCTEVLMLETAQHPPQPMAQTKIIQGTYNVLAEISAPACVEILPEPGTLVLLGLAGVVGLGRRR